MIIFRCCIVVNSLLLCDIDRDNGNCSDDDVDGGGYMGFVDMCFVF